MKLSKTRALEIVVVSSLMILLGPVGTMAEVPPAGHQPAICNGYLPTFGRWGSVSHPRFFCPPNHAYYGIGSPIGSRRPARAVSINGICCKLPSEDILLGEHLYTYDSCPENYVATGIRVAKNGPCKQKALRYALCDDQQGFQLRCTPVNTERYMLGPVLAGRSWGLGSSRWKEGISLKRDELPAGIRYGLMRRTHTDFWHSGCVGQEFGSLLTAKAFKGCTGVQFRQLQFRGVAGDPKSATPVVMFKHCTHVGDIFLEESKCYQ